ncbi:Uncharacterised protein [Yersinia kristensenii]|nr:Uncharacterised protein [Yersinia kristensenii]CNK04702.1 Uncharacterised protein [Yersinia kristensenii]
MPENSSGPEIGAAIQLVGDVTKFQFVGASLAG